MAKSGNSDSSDSDVECDSDKGIKEISSKNVVSSSIIAKPIKTTTPHSILVESLVKSLCSVYERDEIKAKTLYDMICNKLFEMRLIDESYNMDEFEGMRNQYVIAFYQLVTTARGGKQPKSIHAFYPNPDITNGWSHYYGEFEEIGYIAGGGFGKVCVMVHKVLIV